MEVNREIKFRAWDKYKKQMYFVSSIDYDIFSQEIRTISIAHENGMCTAYNKNHNSEECDITALELMQSTGLNDKNGKEIYRGDIIIIICKQYFGGNFVDYCIEKGFVECKDGELGLHRKQGYYQSLKKFFEHDYEIEKIGNIYENSELLGGE